MSPRLEILRGTDPKPTTTDERRGTTADFRWDPPRMSTQVLNDFFVAGLTTHADVLKFIDVIDVLKFLNFLTCINGP